MTAPRVLLVEDDESVRYAIRTFLEVHKFEVEECDSVQRALILQKASTPDLILSDYLLADGNALDLLAKLKISGVTPPFIIITAHGSVDLAVRAMREGAETFLTKPVEMPALKMVIDRSLENHRTRQRELASRASDPAAVDPFLGTSTLIDTLRKNIERILASDTPILLLGETGTGKSLLARWIHEHGSRASEPFVNLNCAGLSKEFLESELFGHDRGAFTGAVTAKPGLLEVAHRGTLFLDEIGEVDAQVQPKLLKVLEEKEFRRLGEVKDRRVDVRMIAATHHDLPTLVRNHRFRDDLYFRINTINFVVPALRDRREDIVPLAQGILQRLGTECGRSPQLSEAAAAALTRYSWPGNVRELRNVLERALILGAGEEITPRLLQFEQAVTTAEVDTSMTLDDFERWYIARVLQEVGGNVDRAATRLAVPRSTLYTKLKQYGIARSRI